MHTYNNLPLQITATAHCCLSHGKLSGRSMRPFAWCPRDCPRCVDCTYRLGDCQWSLFNILQCKICL